MENRKFNFGNLFKGVLIGSIIASVVVLFTAPHSGMETRQMIREKGVELRDRSMKTLEDARERIDTIISDALHPVEQETQQIGEPMEVISHQS